mgnify:CR=1 FL=1
MFDLKKKDLNIPLYVWVIIILVVGYMMIPMKTKNDSVVENKMVVNVEPTNVEVHVFFAPWCGWSIKLMGEKLAEDNFSGSPYEIIKNWCNSNEVKCVAHNSDKEEKYIKSMGIKGFPNILLVEGDRKKSLPGLLAPELVIENIQEFISDKSVMDIPPPPKPKITDGKSGRLTCFYTPWCGWSKRMFGDKLADGNFSGSEYEKIKLAAEKMNLEVIAVNALKNEPLTTTFQVEGYPTCWLQYGDNMEEEFSGFTPAYRMIPKLEQLLKM